MAGQYIADTITTIYCFGNARLKRLCTEERVIGALWLLLMVGLLQRYRKTVDHFRFLLQTERSDNLLTTNHYFSKTLDKLRSDRNAEQTDSFVFGSGTAAQQPRISNLDHPLRNIHDIMKSYYKAARKRFVDNVWVQGTDFHMITGPDTPLRPFPPEFVVELSAEQLEAVAREDATSFQQRKSVEKEIGSLTEGMKILMT